jgi:protein gp37
VSATSIEWCDHTTNPIRARYAATKGDGHYCEKVSPGCQNCYASKMQPRFKMPRFEAQRRLDVEPYFDESKLAQVVERKKPTRYFWCDMSDAFGSWVPDEWLDRMFGVMAQTPQHTHMLLTKRSARMREYSLAMAALDPKERSMRILRAMYKDHPAAGLVGNMRAGDAGTFPWPLPNVWMGVSAENQQQADKRIPDLLATPAAIRFVSAEPLIGPIRFNQQNPDGFWPPNAPQPDIAWLRHVDWPDDCQYWSTGLDWVIVGGESGPRARPFHVEWASAIVAQCKAGRVACFVKQLGADPRWGPDGLVLDMLHDSKGGDIAEWPDYYVGALKVRQFPEARG